MAREDIVVGLDIGTSKIAAIIGNTWQGDPEKIEIIGVGITPSEGLRKGVVVDIDLTTAAIRQAVEAAELMAGVEIGSVYAGIAGGHITGQTSHGLVAVSGEGHEIKQSDVERAINAAQAISIPVEREVLHIIPQGFVVDNQDGIKDPVGMSGIRLEAYVHIITGAVASAQNLLKSIYNAGISVEDIVLEPIASARAVLPKDEKWMGVVLVDMGGGTTDTVVYKDGALHHTAVLSLGGDHVTNDIAHYCKITPQEAERLKRHRGCALVDLVDQNDTIPISTVGGVRKPRYITRQDLAEIIQCRMEEFLSLIGQEIYKSQLLVPAGVVLTGGTALLDGLLELAEQTFPCPVRIGYPRPLKGLTEKVNSPIFSTGVGLVLYGAMERYSEPKRTFIKGTNVFEQILKRMKDWFQDYI
ncbi:MAG: cell division protein FtsA [Candidatus Poribacteria bacterium]|nr:cell division protein FtsA [Candidatus Poribacteria bacterium]